MVALIPPGLRGTVALLVVLHLRDVFFTCVVTNLCSEEQS